MKQLHLIYVPGLGDSRVGGQSWAVARWQRQRGVSSELCQMNWADGEAWPPKLERILGSIDAAIARGQDVGLVAASAGGSAVINAYAARPNVVTGVVIIAGKVNRPESVGAKYKANNPAFWTAVRDCQAALASLTPELRRRIMSRHGIIDEMVLAADNRIPGAVNQLVPTIGHVVTIGTQLTLGARSFIGFLRSLQQP
ncbi:MAG: hypothetical protein ABIV43_01390 [Candidatus Saccharimonadales bacterium]